MNRIQSVLICCASLLLLTSCSRPPVPDAPSAAPGESPAAEKISSETVVKASVEPVAIPAGGSGQATVQISIRNGYHINANPPTFPYLKATEVEVTDTEGILVDYTYYPSPLTKKFSFAEKPLAVYEGQVPVTIAFNAANSAKKGQRSISGTLRIQACDDQVCYPPGKIDIVIPVTIK